MTDWGPYTTVQAARILEISPDTIRKQILRGRLQAAKVGRDWLIEWDDLVAYRAAILGRPGRRGGHS